MTGIFYMYVTVVTLGETDTEMGVSEHQKWPWTLDWEENYPTVPAIEKVNPQPSDQEARGNSSSVWFNTYPFTNTIIVALAMSNSKLSLVTPSVYFIFYMCILTHTAVDEMGDWKRMTDSVTECVPLTQM